MYFVMYCQIKPWVRARLRPLVNSRLINLSHQIQWTLQTCLNLCWSYIQNRNALLDRELNRGMVLFCHILKTLCTSHPSTVKTNSSIKTPIFSLCILFLSAPHLDCREKKIQESCSRLSQKFSGLLKQNPQLHWNNQQVSKSLCWFTCIGTIFCQKRWRLFICSGVKIRHMDVKSGLTPQLSAPRSVLQMTHDKPLLVGRGREIQTVMNRTSSRPR